MRTVERSILGALFVLALVGCGPRLPEVTEELRSGEIEPGRLLAVHDGHAEVVLCEDRRLARAWDRATPEERAVLLDVAVDRTVEELGEHSGHDDHGGPAAEDPLVELGRALGEAFEGAVREGVGELWRIAVAGRAYEDCAGIEARRRSHHGDGMTH